MARIRTVKPELFQHADLFDAEIESGLPLRLAFIGLFTCCDRAGRFKWRPRELKLAVLPHDTCDFARVLEALATRGFILRYASGTEVFGCIPSWSRHQFINNKEPQSTIPEPPAEALKTPILTREPRVQDASLSRTPRVEDASPSRGVKEGNGREEEGKDSSCSEPCGLLLHQEVFTTVPLAGGKQYEITTNAISEWSELYPGIDVAQEVRNAKGWYLANPRRQKTKAGIRNSINYWLAGKQNEGGRNGTDQARRGPTVERMERGLANWDKASARP